MACFHQSSPPLFAMVLAPCFRIRWRRSSATAGSLRSSRQKKIADRIPPPSSCCSRPPSLSQAGRSGLHMPLLQPWEEATPLHLQGHKGPLPWLLLRLGMLSSRRLMLPRRARAQGSSRPMTACVLDLWNGPPSGKQLRCQPTPAAAAAVQSARVLA